jgi:hypothetical protein
VSLATSLGLLLISASFGPAEDGSYAPVVQAKVVARPEESAIVSLDKGRDDGLAVGDRFWIVAGRGLTSGSVYLVSDDAAVGRLNAPRGEVGPGASVAVLRRVAVPLLREEVRPDVMIHGHVKRLIPGEHSAEIDFGQSAGLKTGDKVLIRRRGLPIARGKLGAIGAESATVSLQPTVGNAAAEVGDWAEIWPAPGEARFGRVNTSVLATRPESEGAIVSVVGTPEEGLADGRLVDIYRNGGDYVGVAGLTDFTRPPLSRGQMINAASRDTPQEGDVGIIRSGPSTPPQPLRAVVFRVEGDFCLVAAGEVDGLQRGERMIVHGQDSSPIAELTVEKVNVDYAGARVKLLHADTELAAWEFAERVDPPWPRWQAAGAVESSDGSSRTLSVSVRGSGSLNPGKVLTIVPAGEIPLAAAIVLQRIGDRVLAYVPPAWGEPQELTGASVEVEAAPPVSTSSPASAPVTTSDPE